MWYKEFGRDHISLIMILKAQTVVEAVAVVFDKIYPCIAWHRVYLSCVHNAISKSSLIHHVVMIVTHLDISLQLQAILTDAASNLVRALQNCKLSQDQPVLK